MKRHLYILFVFCVNWMIVSAQEYQLSEIEDIAYTFFNKGKGTQYLQGVNHTHPKKQIATIQTINRNDTNYMYLANAVNSLGWVILANEKKYPTIIAYSDSGSLTYDEEILPPAVLCILENHMNAIDSTRNNVDNNNTLNSNIAYLKDTTIVLLEDSEWKQSCNNDTTSADPNKTYNKYSPQLVTCNKDCGKEPVGCGPIAMSKIMYYWRWPDYAEIGSVHDTLYYYDWEHIPMSINNSTDMYMVDAVAHLFRSCGQAATTAYTCSGSATAITEIHDALRNVFHFHSNLVYGWENIDISSMLINEINDGRPVLAQGYRNGIVFKGHSFVIDGYKKDSTGLYFHTHMGGVNDNKGSNYFDLTFNNYKTMQSFLIELYPDCCFRSDDISLNNTFTIAADENRTYYSTNDIVFCSNNNSITVNSGGHLLVKAGNEVRLKSGFHAKAGCNLRIAIKDVQCNESQSASLIQKKVTSETPAKDWCNQWNIVSHSYRPGQPLYGACTMIYRMEGDTTINQQVYTKLVCTYTNHSATEKWYISALRFTEDKKVYIYYDNTEYLLYDFDVQIGDTLDVFAGIYFYDFHKTYPHVVTNVNKLDDGRLQFYLDAIVRDEYLNQEEKFPKTWIEGVGSVDGIIHNNAIIGVGGNGKTALLCAYHNDECRYVTDNPNYTPLGCVYNEGDVINAVEHVSVSTPSVQKIIKEGQLLILRDGKMYNIMGMEIK